MNLLSAYILIGKGYRTYKDEVPVHRELESNCQEQRHSSQSCVLTRIAVEIPRAEKGMNWPLKDGEVLGGVAKTTCWKMPFFILTRDQCCAHCIWRLQ